MSNITLQQAVDRIAVMAGKINKFKITLTTDDQGNTKELTLQEWLQTLEAHELVGVKDELEALTKLVGTYVADDDNDNLNQNVSVIKNLSEAVGNITSILNREKDTAEKLENLAKLGTFKGHFNTEAERDAALTNAADGWVATIGAAKPFDITIYDATDGKWEAGGQTELFGDNHPIKDLTHLATQDKIYDALVGGDSGYVITVGGQKFITIGSIIKYSTTAQFHIAVNRGDRLGLETVTILKDEHTSIPGGAIMTYLQTQTGSQGTDAANKAYVDAKVGTGTVS